MLASIEDGLLDVISRIEFGGFFLGFWGRGFGVVAREDSAVLGLDRPEASLVVHFRTRVLAHATNQSWVSAASPRLPLPSWRHCLLSLLASETLTLARSPWTWSEI